MYQAAIQQNPSWVTCLALAKFSHATTPIDHTGRLTWTHVNGNGDLNCVFSKFICGALGLPRLILKVVRNNSILEQIDLAYYVQSAANQVASGHDASLPKSPFAVVVKSPCLAVKFPQNGTHVRRFQVKFVNNSDYFTALSILSEINCPLTEGSISIQGPQRPQSSSSRTSAQGSNIASEATSIALVTNQTTAVPFFPTPSYMPGGVITPNPPSSATSTLYNPAVQSSPIRPGQSMKVVSQSLDTTPQLSPETIKTTTSNRRPATAPAFHDQQLTQMLPPKRELPFQKPGSKRPRTGSTNDTAPTQSKPPSPSADQANDGTSYQLTEHDAAHPYGSQVSDSQTQSLLPTQPLSNEIPLSRMSLEPQNTQTYPNSGNSTQAPLLAPPASVEPPVINTQSRESQQASKTIEDQLSLYLASPTTDRIAFLENWMCDLIEDDRFMALCQDVEATWRRFAFGIKK